MAEAASKGGARNAPHCLDMLHEHAASLGGKCLSTEYTNCTAHYSWECGKCSHQWSATWNNVKGHNSWCPNCRTSVRELITRAAFEENFPGKSFAKDQEAIGMELDGYCESECLAFEHDGEQHRVRVPHFQRKEGDFEAQQGRDVLKDERCTLAGITLVRVPDRRILPPAKIRGYVREQLETLGYDLPPVLGSDESFYNAVRCARAEANRYFAEVAQRVQELSGTLVSTQCPTRSWPVKVACHKGHEFETTFDNMFHSAGTRWCPACAPTRRKDDAEVADFAKDRGYGFIGVENRPDQQGRSRKYVTLQCPAGHDPVEMQWDNFRAGRGCKKCGEASRGATKRLDQTTQQQRFSESGLKLIEPYVNGSTPVLVECEKDGYQFRIRLQTAQVAAREGKLSCPQCRAGQFETMRPLAVPGIDFATAKLGWECLNCGQHTEATLKGMSIRVGLGKPCKKCG